MTLFDGTRAPDPCYRATRFFGTAGPKQAPGRPFDPCPLHGGADTLSITCELIQGGNPVTSINPVADYAVEGEVAIVTINSPPVNVFMTALSTRLLST